MKGALRFAMLAVLLSFVRYRAAQDSGTRPLVRCVQSNHTPEKYCATRRSLGLGYQHQAVRFARPGRLHADCTRARAPAGDHSVCCRLADKDDDEDGLGHGVVDKIALEQREADKVVHKHEVV